MNYPIQVERYGQIVWENEEMDRLRRDNCLCYECGRCKIGKDDHCEIAMALYELSKEHGLAMMITRCASWIPRD